MQLKYVSTTGIEWMYELTLKCFHCGKEKTIEVQNPPVFAIQLASWADQAGMMGVIDHAHDRSVVFCNEDCYKAELTKNGYVRLRPKGVA